MTQQTAKLVDHFFRNEFGKAVAYLTNKYGPQYLETAEDVVQDALAKAVQIWPFQKIPDNPSAWIIRVAQNKLIDHLRRQQKVYYATQLPEQSYQTPLPDDPLFTDDQIRMMFACCNPALSAEYQLILTLKILCGLSIKEIAAALMRKEETVAKSYTRAKKKFKDENLQLAIPDTSQIHGRLDRVLQSLYLLFSEGYKCTTGEDLLRKDLCEDAMRLNMLLLENPATNNERTRSFMALMHFQVSRFSTRLDAQHVPVSIKDQNRNCWNRMHIALGNKYLSSISDGLSNTYFLQAAISGIHCAAKTYEETNWPYILMLYNHLYRLSPNPIVALNSIVPIAHVHGPDEALQQLTVLQKEPLLQQNAQLPATMAEVLQMSDQADRAISYLQQACSLADNEAEKRFFLQKTESLKAAIAHQ